MFPSAIKMFIESVLLFIAVSNVNGQDRQLASEINPGCSDCDQTRNPLVYVKAKGSTDTIHQLWDFTEHLPSVAFLVGSPNSKLHVEWSHKRPHKFWFSDHPTASYSFAAVIDHIIEYNDIKDIGQYNPNTTEHRLWPLDRMRWTLTDSLLTDNKEAMVMLRGEQDGKDGVIEMKLDVLPFKDYTVDLPHLIHSANSTLVDIQLVNFTESHRYNSSRFAIHMVLISTDNSSGSWSSVMTKSLDDEHTPGVFEIIEVTSCRLKTRDDGGYLQFRPVAYSEPHRTVSSSTNAYITNINNSSRTSLPALGVLRLLYQDYFGNSSTTNVTQDAVVSFGISGDGFYKQHNFTAWSFNIGYGRPPLDRFSLIVMLTIGLGLGVIVLILLTTTCYIGVQLCIKSRNSRARFENDE